MKMVKLEHAQRLKAPSQMLFATLCYIGYNDAMSRTISQRELRNDSAAVLREVQAGHTIIVCRNGVPVAELRPVPPRRFVPRAVIAEAARRAPRIDAEGFRADLETVVDQSVDGC
jgi:prevent-host-death family protein